MKKEDFHQYLTSVKAAYKKESRIMECFHHNKNECRGKIKKSHSIQRNGRLSIIESPVNQSNSIYTFTSHTFSINHFLDDLVPIGKKEASTFFGFCDYHDTTIFSNIENNKFDGSDKHLFLHSYRSFTHSYHRKMEEHKIYNNPNSEYIKALHPLQVKSMKFGLEMGVKDAKHYKKQLDAAIDLENYTFFEYLVYEKEGLYPFAVSSQMSPRVTYRNKPMNNHLDPNKPWSQPLITFLPDESTTFVILAAFPNDLNSIALIDELEKLPDLLLEKAITSLIIANCENTFISPKAWHKLNKNQQRLLLDEFEANTISDKYEKTFFKSQFNFLSDFFEVQNL